MLRAAGTFILYSCMMFPTLMLTQHASKYYKKNKWIFLFLSIIVLAIPSLFAGFRGSEVGTDVEVYALPEFTASLRYKNISDYLEWTGTDIGFAVLAWLCANLFNSFNVFLIIIELLQLFPIYIVAMKLKDKAEPWLVVFTFFCLHYIVGFNIMRQSMAASFVLLAYVLMKEKRIVQMILSILIAQLFHSTAIVGYALIYAISFVFRMKNKYFRFLITGVVAIVAILILSSWEAVASLLINSGMFQVEKFQTYLSVFNGTNMGEKQYMFNVAFSQYLEIIFKAIYFIVPCYYIKTRKRENDYIRNVEYIAIVGVLINLIVLFMFGSAYGYRIAIYCEYFFVMLIPLACPKLDSRPVNKYRVGTFVVSKQMMMNIFMLLISFIVLFMYFGQHETLPFYFEVY